MIALSPVLSSSEVACKTPETRRDQSIKNEDMGRLFFVSVFRVACTCTTNVYPKLCFFLFILYTTNPYGYVRDSRRSQRNCAVSGG